MLRLTVEAAKVSLEAIGYRLVPHVKEGYWQVFNGPKLYVNRGTVDGAEVARLLARKVLVQ